MNILAFDTSNLPMSIAIINEERVLGEITTNVAKNHSERLMTALESLLRDTGLSLKQMDLITVARGPGSYTGVRIGVTTAKSLAWALQKPLVGVSSLKALAHSMVHYPGIIVPIFDARRGQVYAAGFKWKNKQLIEVIPERIVLIQDLVQRLEESGETYLMIGDDVYKHQAKIIELTGEMKGLSAAFHLPRASHIAELGLQGYLRGEIEDLSFAPQYLQKTEAEVRLREKEEENI